MHSVQPVEIRGAVNGSINELALNDFGVFKRTV